MNRDFMLRHAEKNEFYAALLDGEPAASMILQDNERNQSWKTVDKDGSKEALYVHWLCVHRDFAGKKLSNVMLEFAEKEAKKRKLKFLRLDTNADEEKLKKIYENFGFKLKGIEQEENHRTAFYEKSID